MICLRCHGTGWVKPGFSEPPIDFGKAASLGWHIVKLRSFPITIPCPDCRGTGIVHCCEGDQEQPDRTCESA